MQLVVISSCRPLAYDAQAFFGLFRMNRKLEPHPFQHHANARGLADLQDYLLRLISFDFMVREFQNWPDIWAARPSVKAFAAPPIKRQMNLRRGMPR